MKITTPILTAISKINTPQGKQLREVIRCSGYLQEFLNKEGITETDMVSPELIKLMKTRYKHLSLETLFALWIDAYFHYDLFKETTGRKSHATFTLSNTVLALGQCILAREKKLNARKWTPYSK